MREERTKPTIGRMIFMILAALGGYFVIQTAIDYVRYGTADDSRIFEKQLEENKDLVASEVDKMYDKIKKNAAEQNAPSQTDAIRHASRDLGKQLLEEGNGLERYRTAANMYAGFYVRHTMGYEDFCKPYGVNLSAYEAVFENHHREVTKGAQQYYEVPNQPELLYSHIKKQTDEMIQVEMLELSSAYDLDNKQICMLLNTNAQAIVPAVSFETFMPDAYGLLTGG